MRIAEAARQQFRDEGYFLLPNFASGAEIERMRAACDHYIEEFDGSAPIEPAADRARAFGAPHVEDTEVASMVRRRTADGRIILANILNQKNRRLFLQRRHQENPAIRDFVMSAAMAEICRAVLGADGYFFTEQFVVKYPGPDTDLGWHQDSGYVPASEPLTVTVWCAFDDVDEDNGTIHVLPYSRAGTRARIKHVRQPGSNDRIGYFGDDPGLPVVLSAGGAIVFSSTVFHRSGVNRSKLPRRAFIAEYSSVPMPIHDGNRHMRSADPLLIGGRYVGARSASRVLKE